jgi:hypothetical protein
VPGTAVTIPQPLPQEKEAGKSLLSFASQDPPLDAAEADMLATEPPMIIVTSGSKNSSDDEDESDPNSVYRRDRDPYAWNPDTEDPYSRYSRYSPSTSKERQPSAETNGWNSLSAWRESMDEAMGRTMTYSEKARDERAGQNDQGNASLTSMMSGKSDYQRQEYLERQRTQGSSESSDDVSWNRNYFHFGVTGVQKVQEGQYTSLYEQMKLMNEQATKGASPVDLSDNNGSVPRYGTTGYDSANTFNRTDDAQSRATGQSAAPNYQAYRPAPTPVVSENADKFARQEPPASPEGQVQSRPAILPFPKRPGSVFQ